ncbi:SDR family NAD(P)-dependent oxidoreductase [Limobrevibacterium gyesilva]|uniref:SDR family oxidoreductase n=1 Tax=Limobrevibacterium gyesilva TaxID=2991712 RepID=A0AA42CFC6_9PROT|nr:SDR family NAD(P)-dependent oxidoreductase [Limobrevibacterium gyesilva]MCW3476434.1 SDR family oxidoreductase [Limobrevibacterium gyesilva]
MPEQLVIPDLRGKRCLVTGASSGIGAAVARALGAQGAQVVVHGHSSLDEAEAVADAIRAAGGTAFVLAADLGQRGTAAPLVAEAAARMGGLDLLVNNAGNVLERRPLATMPDDFFDAVMDLNLRSVFEASRAAIPHLRAAGGGAIVSTTSISARHGGGVGVGAYATAKAGVSNLTRALAKELAPDRIRVNAVSPGIILTRIHAQSTPPEMMRQFVAAIPMGRAGTVEDCAGTYLFLASDSLSGYVTGQVIEVNGGQLMP